MSNRLWAAIFVALLVIITGVALAATVGPDRSTPGRTATAGASPSASAALPDPTPAPGAELVVAGDVLPAVDDEAAMPNPAILASALGRLSAKAALGGNASFDVLDVATGRRLASRGPATPRVPASTAKLLTGAAALSLLGPESTLATRVVDGATPDEIVLVGGGDILLSAGMGSPDAVVGHAGLAALARSTATALLAQGRPGVAVRLDDSLFTGPAVFRNWDAKDIRNGFVAPVMSLEINAGRIGEGDYASRRKDPALSAAKTFAHLLGAAGIDVIGQVVRGRARDGAVLAEVQSAPIGDVVEHMLASSDNTVAEALARLVARRSERPATFADAGVAVIDSIAVLGVPVAGARLAGGSGLGEGSAISAQTLTGLLRVAASPEHPELRPLLTGLPVGAATGTLAGRFSQPAERAAAGTVRAKTGTLTGVHALAGMVVDRDGRLLVFAVLADATKGSAPARRAIDAMAVNIAGCGCR